MVLLGVPPISLGFKVPHQRPAGALVVGETQTPHLPTLPSWLCPQHYSFLKFSLFCASKRSFELILQLCHLVILFSVFKLHIK